MNREIDIKNREQAVNICRLATKTPYEVWLRAGTALVNAGSMLSMLTMVGKKACVEADNEGNAESFARQILELA